MSRPPVATPAGWHAVILCAALAGGVCSAVVLHPPLTLCVVVLLAGAGCTVFSRIAKAAWATLPVLVAVACTAGLARGVQSDASGSAWAKAIGPGSAILTGTVREGTGARRNAAQVVVDVDHVVRGDAEIAVRGGVLATLRKGPPVLPGDRVQLDVAGLRPRGSGTIADILSREGIDAVAQSPTLTVQSEGGPTPVRLLAIARARLASAVDAALPEPAASLVDSVVFGMRRPLSADLTAALQDSGLAHVLAVSGLKVVLVAGMASALVGVLALPPGVRRLLMAGAVGAYVVLSGAGPAAVRSAVMAGAGWGLQGTGRLPDPLPLLAATAAAMLMVDPGLARDTGFQLSILGTLGILLLAAPISQRLPGPRLLRDPFAVTVAAQLATVPVTAAAFGVISLVGPLANALVVPLLPALIAAGAGGAVVALFVPLFGTAALATAAGLALFLGAVATYAAALPLAAVHVAAWPRLYVVAEVSALAVALLGWSASRHRIAARGGPLGATAAARTTTRRMAARRLRLPRWRVSRPARITLAAAVALAAGGTVLIAGTRPDGRLHVAVLDVGAARAVAVRTASGAVALVDTGSDPQHLLQALGPALPPLTRTLDLLVLTGGDRAAAGGLAGLADRYTVTRAVVPAQGLGSAVRTALDDMHARGTDVAPAPPDAAWTWGGATWSLLNPDGAFDEGTALAVSDPSGRVLLLGNLTVAAQEELAARRGPALIAELVVAPPSATVAPALADAAHPRLLAIPDARSTRGARSSRGTTSTLPSGLGVRHTGTAGTLTYIGSEEGLVAT